MLSGSDWYKYVSTYVAVSLSEISSKTGKSGNFCFFRPFTDYRFISNKFGNQFFQTFVELVLTILEEISSPATTFRLFLGILLSSSLLVVFLSFLMQGRNNWRNSFLYFLLKTPYTTALTLEFKQVIKVIPVTEKLPIANIQNIVSVMLHITNRVTTTMTIEATLFSEFCDEAEDCIVLANCLLVCLTWKARKSILFQWFSWFDMKQCVNYVLVFPVLDNRNTALRKGCVRTCWKFETGSS